MKRMNFRTGRRSLRLLVVATVGLAVAAGVAYATIPDATGVINGCYRTSLDDQRGQLRVVDDPASCRSNETPIQWNQKGPKGDTGEQGIQGLQGLKGDTGATGAEGPKGDKGDTGAAGTNGTNGVDGKDGQPGTNGTNGSDGADGVDGAPGAPGDPCLPTNAACVGPQGDPGAKGDTGATGPKGDPGPAGPATESLMGTSQVPACPTTSTSGCEFLAAPVGFSSGVQFGDITTALQTNPLAITTPAVATTGSALAANGPAPGSANGFDRRVEVYIRVVPNGPMLPCQIRGAETSCVGAAPPSMVIPAGSRVVAIVSAPAGYPGGLIGFGWRLG